MVVAQLVERLLPMPEVRGLNPVIGKNYIEHLFIVYCQLCIEKTKIKKKEAVDGPFKKKLTVNPPYQQYGGCLLVKVQDHLITSTKRPKIDQKSIWSICLLRRGQSDIDQINKCVGKTFECC